MASDIRQTIDTAALERYLEQKVPAIRTPVEVKQFSFGQSNPTYLLTSAGADDGDRRRYVLRKKPPGALFSKTAHRVEREYEIIHALKNTAVPVPKTYDLCEDASVLGTPFYIMEFVDGRIFTEAWLPGVLPEQRTKMWRSAIEILASLHLVPPASVNLHNFGKSSDFYNRQLRTLTSISRAQAAAVDVDTKISVGQIPHFDEMVAFFGDRNNQPSDRASLIHGDYKIDNLVFHKSEPRVIGILDWELATIGHPLSDLVNLISPWPPIHQGPDTSFASSKFSSRASPAISAPSSPEERSQYSRVMTTNPPPQSPFTPNVNPGLPTLDQCIRWYEAAARWDPVPFLRWGRAFGRLRDTVIMQGIAARQAQRQASGMGMTAIQLAKQFKPYGEATWQLVQEMPEKREEFQEEQKRKGESRRRQQQKVTMPGWDEKPEKENDADAWTRMKAKI